MMSCPMKCIRILSTIVVAAVIVFGPARAWSQDASVAPPAMNLQVKSLVEKALEYKTAGDLIKSRETYQSILVQYPETPGARDLLRQVWDLNVAIIFSDLQTHQTQQCMVAPGDTLKKIAKKFGTTIDLIKRRNRLETTRIKAGQKLSVWLGPFTIWIDKSDNTLTLKTGDEIVKVYPVSTGKNDSSPVGKFTIIHRYTDPVWFHKGEIVEAKSPKNYLGTRWLGFDLPKYGIHGTIEPQRIGQQVSSGCIRMRNEDVQELYEMIPAGTVVTIDE
jgi:lipoprotein-anchoring transpeptidase ErfK/SrfK